LTSVEEILTKILNTLTRAEKTQLEAPYLVNRYRHLFQNGKITISTKPVFLDKIIVSKGGDQCVLTIWDGSNEIFKGVLNPERVTKGREIEPYNIKIASEIQNELFAELHSPRASTHYKLNSITGANCINSGTDGIVGVNQNMANDDWVAGKMGRALDFDGDNDYIDCGNQGNYDYNEKFSVVFWIYPHTATGTEYLICKRETSGASKGRGIYLYPNGLLNFFFTDGAVGDFSNRYLTPLTVNTWVHVVWTYDGSNKAEGMKLYLNGTRRTTNIMTTYAMPGSVATSKDLVIGAGHTGGNNFDGLLDDVRIYGEELTPEHAKLLYDSAISKEEEFNVGDVILTYKQNIIPTGTLEVK